MKVGVLTQPLHNNYGGLLQAYALKEVLSSMGHEVVVINRRKKIKSRLRRLLSFTAGSIKGRRFVHRYLITEHQRNVISSKTNHFRDKHIPLSHLITNDKEMSKLNQMGFCAYVVGSDQSWRPKYSPKISNYFLDFAEKEKDIKRISYAVSFGVSEWEFTKKDTIVCEALAKKFDAISVREHSGIALVNKYFGKEAQHLLDPTMLLSKEHYQSMATTVQEKNTGAMKVYVLDRTDEKTKLIELVEKKTGYKSFEIMPKKLADVHQIDVIEDFVYPSPLDWLKGYQDAKFVVTDSFHGTVFSILFNIPFIAIGNTQRGMSRFESLLSIFGLEHRLIRDLSNYDVETLLRDKIDWGKINKTLQGEREKSIRFLKNNL